MSGGLDETTTLEPVVGRGGAVYEETAGKALVTAVFVGTSVPRTVVARAMDVVVVTAGEIGGGVVQAVRAAETAALTPAVTDEDVERLADALDADRRVRDRYDASVDDLDRLERGDRIDVANSNVTVVWLGDEKADVGALVAGSTATYLHVAAGVEPERVRTALDDVGVDPGPVRLVERPGETEVEIGAASEAGLVADHADDGS